MCDTGAHTTYSPDKNAPPGHTRDFDLQPVSPFRRGVDVLQYGASGRQAAALLDNRISRQVAGHWLTGRRQAPRWALQSLARQIQDRADKLAAIAHDLRQIKERPGLSTGARNLAKWKARSTEAAVRSTDSAATNADRSCS